MPTGSRERTMADMTPPKACLIGRDSREGRHTILLVHRGVCLGLAILLKEVKDQNSADCMEQELPSGQEGLGDCIPSQRGSVKKGSK